MWVHYYDPHAPYEPPADLADRFRDAPYDGEIASVDRELARVLKAIEQRGELGKTVVLVTADHGESLGEHGEGAHGLFVYDATIRVPWIMAGPGIGAGPRLADGRAADRRACRRCTTTPACRRARSWKADRFGRRLTGAGWTTRRRTPSRSIRSSSSGGRRSTRGALAASS